MSREQRLNWDDANRRHLARHHISSKEVNELFSRFWVEVVQDPIDGEPRFTALGTTAKGRHLAIGYTERNGLIRPITGWDMDTEELERYVEELYNQ